MKQKDRIVRVSNLNLNDPIYTIHKQRFKYLKILQLLLFVVFFINVPLIAKVLYFILFFLIFFIRPKHKLMEFYEDFLLYYNDAETAVLIYYDEIRSYRIKEINYEKRKILLYLNNKDEYSFEFIDTKALKVIEELIGDKNAYK